MKLHIKKIESKMKGREGGGVPPNLASYHMCQSRINKVGVVITTPFKNFCGVQIFLKICVLFVHSPLDHLVRFWPTA